MNITMPDTLSSLAAWYIAGMAAMFALGIACGILYSRSKLADAAAIAAILVHFQPEIASELGIRAPRPSRIYVWARAGRMRINRARASLRLALRFNAPTVTPTVVSAEPERPRARDRFARRPGEFPLLHANPLVPLATSPKMPTEPERRFADRMFLVITRNGAFSSAAFLPA